MAKVSPWNGLLIVPLLGVFSIFEVVRDAVAVSPQASAPPDISSVPGIIAELIMAVFSAVLGFCFLRCSKTSKRAQKEKQQLKAKKHLFGEPDSEMSTCALSDSSGTWDEDEEGTAAAQNRASYSCAADESFDRKGAEATLDSKANLKQYPWRQKSSIGSSACDSADLPPWRRAAAGQKAAQQPDTWPKRINETPKLSPGFKESIHKDNSTSMPTTLSAGGCALLKLLREEQRSKLQEQAGPPGLGAPPGL